MTKNYNRKSNASFSKSDSATQGQIIGNGVFDIHIWSWQQFLLEREPFRF